ncbi:PAS domain-containing protein [Scytonema millei]|nr:PAS domain-containing protein [Scytonema millei]
MPINPNKFAENTGELTMQLEAMCRRLENLYIRAKEPAWSPAELLAESFRELSCSLEEIYVAIEELRQQNEELAAARFLVEQERQRYQDLFELAPDGYFVTNAAGVILEANRAAVSLLNAAPEYLVGKPLVLFVERGDRSSFRSQLNRLCYQIDRLQNWQVRIQPHNCEPYDALLTATVVRDREGTASHLRICLRQTDEQQVEIGS